MSGSKGSLPPCRNVAVVGAGLAGLASIISLKEEGINPVCFEKTNCYGGTWCYKQESVEGLASVMWSTVINHSKEFGSLSTYPYPKEYSNYMKHTELYRYVQTVAEKFGILRHVNFNHEVIKVKKADDYEETGRWSVTVKNVVTGEVTSRVFDGVMVCAGQFSYPKLAKFDGLDKFRGRILHSHSLKTVQEFFGKRVVVVGTGCSALDAAVDVSAVAEKVYWSFRTPSWIVSRLGPYGLPVDYCLLRRYITLFQDILPVNWASAIVEKLFFNRIFNHKLYGMEPKYHFLSRDPIFNDYIGAKILSGSVLPRKNIKRFVNDGVVFEGEDEETEVDVVIMCTGYEWKFPFLDDGILKCTGDKTYLYKCMYPPQLKYHTLAFIGLFLPLGSGFPLGELQTRWAAHLFSGKGSLPAPEVMLKDIDDRHNKNSRRFSPHDKTTVRVDFIPFADEIASQFGVKPNFWKMLFTDPRLFVACIFGPSLPYQYRLYGPHKWDGAREAILTAPERVQYPLTRMAPKVNVANSVFNYICGHAFILLFLGFIFIAACSPFLSWESLAECLFVLYVVTIFTILCKFLGDILVNRTFWS